MGRRQFLRMLAAAGAAAVLPVPMAALGASRRPPFELIFPQDPVATWFAQTFGLAKADGRIHMGIDLMAPKLSPVYAIAEGTINRIGQSPRAGRHMIIDHADGWQSWYLHLNNDDPDRNNGRADWSMTVADELEESSHVTAGRHIAYVGNSGNAEGGMSHTHFELHLGSRILNPYPYLVAGQVVALEAAEQEQLVETVHTMCQPEDARPSIDSEVCPVRTDQLREIPKGMRGAS